jgi:hypothetical protein
MHGSASRVAACDTLPVPTSARSSSSPNCSKQQQQAQVSDGPCLRPALCITCMHACVNLQLHIIYKTCGLAKAMHVFVPFLEL